MGLRFDLSGANWLAYILDPGARIPTFQNPRRERDTLQFFLHQLSERFYSSRPVEQRFESIVRTAEQLMHELDREGCEEVPDYLLKELRRFLGNRPWTALIIPTGYDQELDRELSHERFLRHLVSIRADDPGLILQLEGVPQDAFTVLDVFPAFKTALAESTNWPGILIWSPRGDSIFLPFGSKQFSCIEKRAQWILSHLATSIGTDLALLKSQYLRSFPEVYQATEGKLHILQLSDLHLGSKDANRRIPRVQQLVRNILDELGGTSKIVPIVTGDLMDSPSEEYLNNVRAFLDFLSSLGIEEPVIVLGNHDVRKDGCLLDCYRLALRLPSPPARWFDDERVGLLCVNSVVAGKLARGYIGETQLMDLGSELDRKEKLREFQLVAMLHHHPVHVHIPEWYAQPFYERVLGSAFTKTDELEDADAFLNFAEERSIAAILHGHKHIPQATKARGSIPVFGCGSSVGKVSTTDGGTYISLNIVTVDSRSRMVVGRLLAERIPGGGLVEQRRHEVVLRTEGSSE